MSEWPKSVKDAFKKAKVAREHAHAPYSRFKVGAAVKFQGSRKVFAGCNVENSSFGGTNCAERTALFSGVAELGVTPVDFIVLVTSQNPVASPCGICRQVLAEFASDDTPIYLADLRGIRERVLLGELLPRAFRNFKSDR
ncbi:MAG: cytidine deaminase [Bdellovibrionaceae bacterium]|nr:cytidine deaminase [Pseudobdellovibrionaceae bacterium]|tara:strand:- start:1080 stop:1499 length:420 start_codon:yes stop_codon:yes gene_type:complete